MGGYTCGAGFGERNAWFVTPLFDAESGEPLAVLDGGYLNPFKTPARRARSASTRSSERTRARWD